MPGGLPGVGLNLDQHGARSQPKRHCWGPQLKWAHDWHPDGSVGSLAWAPARQSPVETGTPHSKASNGWASCPGGQIPMWQGPTSAERRPRQRPARVSPPAWPSTQWHPLVPARWFDDRLAPGGGWGLRHQFDAHWSLVWAARADRSEGHAGTARRGVGSLAPTVIAKCPRPVKSGSLDAPAHPNPPGSSRVKRTTSVLAQPVRPVHGGGGAISSTMAALRG